jgi:arylsulfatase A-like enzyme
VVLAVTADLRILQREAEFAVEQRHVERADREPEQARLVVAVIRPKHAASSPGGHWTSAHAAVRTFERAHGNAGRTQPSRGSSWSGNLADETGVTSDNEGSQGPDESLQ